MRRQIQGIYDGLMPSYLEPGSNGYTRGTIFITVLFTNCSFLLLSLAWIMGGMELQGEALNVAVEVFAFIALIYGATFVVLRWKRSFVWAANVMMLAVVVPVYFAILHTGGLSHSPITPLILTAALMSFVLGGFVIGVAWTAGAFLGYWLLFFLERVGFVFPVQLLDEKLYREFDLFIPLASSMLSIAAIVVYEFLNGRLRRKLNSKRQQFAFQAAHDALTQIPNRDSFNHSVQLSMDSADLGNKKLALVYLDLDGFKPINDVHGHHAGDIVLQAIAQRLRSIIRGSDTVARLGGDEFGLLFCGYESREVFERMLRKILEVIGEDIPVDGVDVSVSGSLGVAIYPDDAVTFEKLCRHADMAMYRAKKKKNAWCFYLDQVAVG